MRQNYIPSSTYTHSFPHCQLPLPRPPLFIPAGQYSQALVLADLKLRYGHLNTTYVRPPLSLNHSHRRLHSQTPKSPGRTRSLPRAWPRTYGHRLRSRGLGQQPLPSGPATGPHPTRTRRPHPTCTRDRQQAEGISKTYIISLIF